MKSLLTRFVSDQSGVTAIEYGLIAALISVVCIAAMTSLVSSSWQSIRTLVTPSPAPSRREKRKYHRNFAL